jgi:hypothetical protein
LTGIDQKGQIRRHEGKVYTPPNRPSPEDQNLYQG